MIFSFAALNNILQILHSKYKYIWMNLPESPQSDICKINVIPEQLILESCTAWETSS